uniref:U6 snRNA-associated Sm-like protein LSm4 n=1 Tax=Panagrellus redivivus TaxID=6233 RepID=A0A7E4WAH2_PANRE
MVLPLSLLRSTQNQQMLIELKNGDSYNGLLVACDSWMNVHLKDTIFTSKDGDKFVKIGEIFIRGPTIKLMHIPDEVMSAVNDEVIEVRRQQPNQRYPPRRGGHYNNGGNRGGRGGGNNARGGYQNRNQGGPGPSGQGGPNPNFNNRGGNNPNPQWR